MKIQYESDSVRIRKKIPYGYWSIFSVALITMFTSKNACADIDADALRKLTAMRSIALSSEPISPEQVGRELAVELKTSCSDVDYPVEGKFRICNSTLFQGQKDIAQLAFVHYSTVNRPTEKDTGGVVEFSTRDEENCIHQNELTQFFHISPTSSTPVLLEPALPYIPVIRYDFVFPKQGKYDVSVQALQTGECVSLLSLSKTSYKTMKEK